MALAQPVNKLTKYDIITIILLLIISVSSILYFYLFNTEKATGVDIFVDGKLYSSYSFAELKDGETIEIHTEYGYNKFLFKNKSIICTDTDCKDKLEVKTGAIKKVNQILVCVPHKLTVQITGKNRLDGISY